MYLVHSDPLFIHLSIWHENFPTPRACGPRSSTPELRLFLLLVLLVATATAVLLLLLPLAVLQHLLADPPELHPHAQLPCRCVGVRLRRRRLRRRRLRRRAAAAAAVTAAAAAAAGSPKAARLQVATATGSALLSG
jgi:hypothetical protein